MNKRVYKGCSLMLASAMVLGCTTSCSSRDAAVKSDPKEDPVTTALTQTVKKQKKSSDQAKFKEETVYVFTDANGEQKNVLVNEKLNNPDCGETIDDETTLSHLVNLTGDEDYTSEDGDTIRWNAEGNEIIYQGDTDQTPPVSIKATYYLDGEEIRPQDLAGKSGHVNMKFDYTNNEVREVETADGKKTMYVPFTAVTGMLLSGDKFSDIEVTNGKVTEVGDNYMVAGIVLPGMQDSLSDKLEDLDITLDIPSDFEVSADVTDFSLDMIVTVVTADLAADINLGDIDTSSLEGKMEELQSATDQLADGTSGLSEGTGKLDENMPALVNGATELETGANQLKDGADQMKNGVKAYTDGVAKAADGAGQISEGAEKLDTSLGALNRSMKETVVPGVSSLAEGADALSEGVNLFVAETGKGLEAGKAGAVATANAKLAAAEELTAALGYTVTMENIDATIEALEAKRNQLQAELTLSDEEALQHAVAAGVKQQLLAAGMEEGTESYTTAFSGAVTGQLTLLNSAGAEAQKTATIAAYRGAVSEQAKNLPVLDSTIEQLKEARASVNGAQAALDQVKSTLEGNEDVKKLTEGANALAAGADSLKQGIGTYDEQELNAVIQSGNNTVCSALYQLENGADTLSRGTDELSKGLNTLKENSAALNSGATSLSDGTTKLAEGTTKLKDATTTLSEGVGELNAGAVKLDEGMLQFKEEGISKLSGAFDDSSDTLISEFKELLDLGKNYKSFAGKSNDYDGNVIFIYKMDGIG
ncbi:MAG: hypothetical protein J5825_00665 [Lachnospiraceae bacterium]|nr:hypothetical protein [Lachnospiraceae bacterium]